MNEKTIDYLQYSMYVSREKLLSTCEQISPVRNYKQGYRQPNGVRVYTGNALTKKALFIVDGTTLHNMRVNGISNEDYIEKILTSGATISRIDLQVTQFVSDDLITPSDYLQMIRDNEVLSSHVKHGTKWLSSLDENYSDNIETLYIGDMSNRGKRGIVRAYDKGVELDLGKYLISRLEVEDKRDKAHVSARRIVNGASVAEVLKTRFDCNNERWQNLIDADSIDTTRGEQIADTSEEDKMTSRWKWLTDVVAKSLGEAIAYDEDNGLGEGRKQLFELVMSEAYKSAKVDN